MMEINMEELEVDSDELFSQFLYAYLDYLIHLCQCVVVYDEDGNYQEQVGVNMIRSFTLLWQLHAGLVALRSKDGAVFPFHSVQFQKITPKLRELKSLIESFPVTKKDDQSHCIFLIKQIKAYYEQHNLVIVEPQDYAKPWLASTFGRSANQYD